MSDEFVRVQISPGAWLSACRRCRQVLAFSDSVESLCDAEAAATHECHEAKQQTAQADPAE